MTHSAIFNWYWVHNFDFPLLHYNVWWCLRTGSQGNLLHRICKTSWRISEGLATCHMGLASRTFCSGPWWHIWAWLGIQVTTSLFFITHNVLSWSYPFKGDIGCVHRSICISKYQAFIPLKGVANTRHTYTHLCIHIYTLLLRCPYYPREEKWPRPPQSVKVSHTNRVGRRGRIKNKVPWFTLATSYLGHTFSIPALNLI